MRTSFLPLAECLPITDAIRQHKLVGLPSYHMIDNPVYREALPFGNQDIDLIRQHGLAVMARIRTVGGSPIKHKQVPMPSPTKLKHAPMHVPV